MSTLPENEFDLEKLFLPSWAQEEPSSVKYAKYEGETDRERPEGRRERRGPRPPRREGFGPGGRREDRPRGERRGPRPPGPGYQGGPGEVREDRGPRGRGERFAGPRRGGPPPERRPPPAPLPEINLSIVPEDKGVESLARQIKISGRAYPLFDIAQMILQKPERVVVTFSVKKNAEGQPLQPLFVCALDDTLWLSEEEAVAHVLRKHFATFYQAEKTATEPPKGKYTFVAQCGMSGIILGPPNHHDYQNQIRKLHTERFSRMPFEVYKSRVRIVRDEEVVKKWVEDQSWKTDYICLNMPEPLRLGNMEAVEKHFREIHKDIIIKPVEKHTLNGVAARALRSPELVRAVRSVWDDQRRFPLQVATVLSQQFASHGLQFFKVNKTITHVAVARPHYLDLALTPVSQGVKNIVDFINANPKSTRRKLLEALAPAPVPAPIPLTPPPASAAEPVAAAAAPTTSPEGATPAEPHPAAPAPPPAPRPAEPQPTPEQTAVISDLHWLIHQGHVIEFANGVLETAKKPLPKPPKEPKPAPTPPEAAPAEAAAPAEVSASAEVPTPAETVAPVEAPAATEAPVPLAEPPTAAVPTAEPPAAPEAAAAPPLVEIEAPKPEPPPAAPVPAPADSGAPSSAPAGNP